MDWLRPPVKAAKGTTISRVLLSGTANSKSAARRKMIWYIQVLAIKSQGFGEDNFFETKFPSSFLRLQSKHKTD